MSNKYEDEIIPWLAEAKDCLEAFPDKKDEVLMWVYCQGNINAIRAFKELQE